MKLLQAPCCYFKFESNSILHLYPCLWWMFWKSFFNILHIITRNDRNRYNFIIQMYELVTRFIDSFIGSSIEYLRMQWRQQLNGVTFFLSFEFLPYLRLNNFVKWIQTIAFQFVNFVVLRRIRPNTFD